MSLELVPPHGGRLKPLLLKGEERVQEMEKAKTLPVVRLTSRETSDLIMMAMGALSPLEGFMGKEDYIGVVENMHMADGTLWPIPITVSVTKEEADTFGIGTEVALLDDESGELMGSMTVTEKYGYDKKHEAKNVFRTEDEAHPGVAKVYAQKEMMLAGPVKVFSEGPYPLRPARLANPAEIVYHIQQ